MAFWPPFALFARCEHLSDARHCRRKLKTAKKPPVLKGYTFKGLGNGFKDCLAEAATVSTGIRKWAHMTGCSETRGSGRSPQSAGRDSGNLLCVLSTEQKISLLTESDSLRWKKNCWCGYHGNGWGNLHALVSEWALELPKTAGLLAGADLSQLYTMNSSIHFYVSSDIPQVTHGFPIYVA